MKFKKVTIQEKLNLEARIKLLLFAGLDYCENTNKGREWWFSPLNPYYTEAFGILQGLEVLEYGYFGGVECPYSPENLNWWFEELKVEVAVKGDELGPQVSYYWFKEQQKIA